MSKSNEIHTAAQHLAAENKKENRTRRGFEVPLAVALPLTVIYLELVLRATSGLSVMHDGLACGLFAALFAALLVAAVCALIRRPSAAFAFAVIFAEISAIWFLAAYFINNSYFVFMHPSIVISTAGDAVKDFSGDIKNVFINGLPMILLYHIPTALLIILRRRLTARGGRRLPLILFALAFLCQGASVLFGVCTPVMKAQFTKGYDYDGAVRNFGLISALEQDVWHSVFGDGSNSALSAMAEDDSALSAASIETAPEESPAVSDAPEEKDYGVNAMDIDFDREELTGSSNLKALGDYVQSLTPSAKNEYTGIFEGKNLILLTAESFSKEIIDAERTPMLYRLANRGIVFEDFYQPVWGGSTSTGEYSWLTGLAPTSALAMQHSFDKNLYFTMGNQLQRLGYFSAAYHNGTYTYYSRHTTHTNLGYSTYTAIGNGLEAGLSSCFPASDLEMIDFTVPQYIDSQPFSIYYMTISGHAGYGFSSDINAMSVKNKDVVEDMPYSDKVRAYYACNQELENALESLVRQLNEAGILDNTVIALCPDHYPYALMPSGTWGSQSNSLDELYGYKVDSYPKRDHNAAIIWSPCLEELDEPIVVSDPTSSLDILPTLSNLFGVEFDSRLLVGRDVLSDTQPLVFWTDASWLTEKGFYYSAEGEFTPADGVVMTDEEREAYIERMTLIVQAKLSYSKSAANNDYFGALFGPDE